MRWAREPLVHFALLGLLLFALYAALERDAAPEPGSRRIELTVDDLRQLEIAFRSRWQRPPTPDEMVALVEGRVREEVLYREALALGLDVDDAIVRRRMAQKMEFLAEDEASAREPTRDELERWFAENAQRFALPARVSFRHLYFSPDRRAERARDDAAAALAELAGRSAETPAAKRLGDAFMFRDAWAERSPEQVAKDFGPGFAQALFALEPGSWQGPLESGYGWHLVFVSASTPERVPAFAEVEAEVATAWHEAQRAEARRSSYQRMRASYELVLPSPPAEVAKTPRDAVDALP